MNFLILFLNKNSREPKGQAECVASSLAHAINLCHLTAATYGHTKDIIILVDEEGDTVWTNHTH